MKSDHLLLGDYVTVYKGRMIYSLRKKKGETTMLNMNTEQYENAIKVPGQYVLVEFLTPWCVYCRRIAHAMDRISKKYEHELMFVQVNIDEEQELAEKECIEVVPTLVLYRDGKSVGSVVAPESKAQIEAFINAFRGK